MGICRPYPTWKLSVWRFSVRKVRCKELPLNDLFDVCQFLRDVCIYILFKRFSTSIRKKKLTNNLGEGRQMPTLEQRLSQTRVPLDYASLSNISWGECAYTESRWLLEMNFTVKTMKLSAFWGLFLKKMINEDERVLKNEKLHRNDIWRNFILMFFQLNSHKLLRAKSMYTKLGDILEVSAFV